MSGLSWPSMTSDVNKYCGSCETCQLRARQRRSDKVPISIVEKAGEGQVFSHMHCDVFGPILPNKNIGFNYALIVVDSTSRYPFACPLRSLHANNICDALMSIFEFTGICSSMVMHLTFVLLLQMNFLNALVCRHCSQQNIILKETR